MKALIEHAETQRFRSWRDWWIEPQSDNRGHHRAVSVICCSGIVVIGLLIIFSPRGLFYDEEAHLGALLLLQEKGLTNDFLRQLLVTTGPLLPVIQYLALVVTKSSPFNLVGLRLLNLPLIVGAVYSLHLLFKYKRVSGSASNAAVLFALPLVWMVSGIIFTESPTLLFLSLGLLSVGVLSDLLVSDNRDDNARQAQAFLLAVLAGLCGGLAFAGRQTAIPFLLAAPLLAVRFGAGREIQFVRASLVPVLAFIITGAAIPAWLIWVWKGATPPSHYFVNDGLKIEHGLMNFAFAGGMFLLLSPGLLKMSLRSWSLLLSGTTALNYLFFRLDIWFLTRIARMFLPVGLLDIYKYVSTGLLLGLGIGSIICLLRAAWAHRQDFVTLYAAVVTMIILAEAAKITFVFTYRYTVTAAPFMIWLVSKYAVTNRFRLARLIIAQLLGFMLLFDLLYLAKIP